MWEVVLMKKRISIVLFIFLLSLPKLSLSGDFGRKSFDAPQNANYSISLYGPFNSPGIATPNETIFTYLTGNKKYPIEKTLMFVDQYKFTGRTGEKTFELEHIYTLAGKFKHETLKMYFEENTVFPLSVMTLYSGCEKNDKINLKMLKLTGPQLEFQIILPACLEK
jgi:hypothetical protein